MNAVFALLGIVLLYFFGGAMVANHGRRLDRPDAVVQLASYAACIAFLVATGRAS